MLSCNSTIPVNPGETPSWKPIAQGSGLSLCIFAKKRAVYIPIIVKTDTK